MKMRNQNNTRDTKTGEHEDSKQVNHDIERSATWHYHEKNPDYQLAVINADNSGFQSKMSMTTGSYTLTQLTQRLADNIYNRNNSKFLQDILHKE